MRHNEIASNERNVAQRSGEYAPIPDWEQPQVVEDSEAGLNEHRRVAQAHPTDAQSDWDLGFLKAMAWRWRLVDEGSQ